jgi:hypothetical protein
MPEANRRFVPEANRKGRAEGEPEVRAGGEPEVRRVMVSGLMDRGSDGIADRPGHVSRAKHPIDVTDCTGRGSARSRLEGATGAFAGP